MDKVNIRKAVPDDIKRIVALIKSLPTTGQPKTESLPLLVNKDLNITETIITNQVYSDELNLYVAEVNNHIIGAVYLNHATNYIGHFYVKPCDGWVFEALLMKIIDEAINYKLTTLTVKTHLKATNLVNALRKHGFDTLTDEPLEDETSFYTRTMPLVVDIREMEPTKASSDTKKELVAA